MQINIKTIKNQSLTFLFWIALTLLFIAIIGGFRVLYSATQHYHFLFPLALGGMEDLASDWVVPRTATSPFFGYLVRVTYQYLHGSLFYVYQAVLCGIYLFSLIGIADHYYEIKRKKFLFFIFLAVYLISYAVFWPGSAESLLYGGFANQRMELHLFIPNSFAALLFLSIYQYLKKEKLKSVISLVAACYFHVAYLICGAALVTAYMVSEHLEHRNLKRVFILGAGSLILVLPIVVMYLSAEGQASAEQINQAAHIIATLRLPFHAQARVWWDKIVTIKILFALGALVVTRKTRLFPIILTILVFSVVPSVASYIRPSNKFGMFTLWRSSIMLVPLASTMLIASLVTNFYTINKAELNRHRNFVVVVLLILGVIMLVDGLRTQLSWIDSYQNRVNRPILEFVRQTKQPGDLYLVPPREHELQSFRLDTGMPVFVDWTIHPWHVKDVLEWYDRVLLADEFFQLRAGERCPILSKFVNEFGVTHVVLPSTKSLKCSSAQMVYSDNDYSLFFVAQ